MATIHHFPHRMADAGLEERRVSSRPAAPRSFVPPLPRAHLRMVEPGERIDLYASLRDGGHDKAPARHPALLNVAAAVLTWAFAVALIYALIVAAMVLS